MIDKNVLALLVTLAIIGAAFLGMRRGGRWLEEKLRSRPVSGPTAPGAAMTRHHRHELEYPAQACTGGEALAVWEQARREGRGIPVIVADWPASGRWPVQRLAADVLEAAAAITDPLPLWSAPDRSRPWPAPGTVVANSGPGVVRSFNDGRRDFLPQVHVVVLPAAHASEIPAYLDLGGWNDCPRAERMVAALRQWGRDYGAELVAIGRDTMDIRVARRPSTRKDAMLLARQQIMFCSDVVEDPESMLEELAAELMVSDWWFFWWD